MWEKEAGKIVAKRYPQSLADLYIAQIGLLKTAAETAHSTYAAEVVKPEQTIDKAACETSKDAAKMAQETLDEDLGDFKTNNGADLKKLVA